MSTRKWGETESGAEYYRNSQLQYTHSDSPQSAGYRFTTKLWIFNSFSEQHPPEHLGTNLKYDLCHQAFISPMKHEPLPP